MSLFLNYFQLIALWITGFISASSLLKLFLSNECLVPSNKWKVLRSWHLSSFGVVCLQFWGYCEWLRHLLLYNQVHSVPRLGACLSWTVKRVALWKVLHYWYYFFLPVKEILNSLLSCKGCPRMCLCDFTWPLNEVPCTVILWEFIHEKTSWGWIAEMFRETASMGLLLGLTYDLSDILRMQCLGYPLPGLSLRAVYAASNLEVWSTIFFWNK